MIYRMPFRRYFRGGRTLGCGGLQPTTRLSGCSTSRILSPLCICNIFVTSHPLCPKCMAYRSKVKKKSGMGTRKLPSQPDSKLRTPMRWNVTASGAPSHTETNLSPAMCWPRALPRHQPAGGGNATAVPNASTP